LLCRTGLALCGDGTVGPGWEDKYQEKAVCRESERGWVGESEP